MASWIAVRVRRSWAAFRSLSIRAKLVLAALLPITGLLVGLVADLKSIVEEHSGPVPPIKLEPPPVNPKITRADPKVCQTKPSELGYTAPPGFALEALAGDDMSFSETPASTAWATLRKRHHQSGVELGPLHVRLADSRLLRADFDTTAGIESYRAYGEVTPHGFYNIGFSVLNARGRVDEQNRSFNYVFRPAGPLMDRYFFTVGNSAFHEDGGVLVFEEQFPRRGYSSSSVKQAFEFPSDFVIQGSFLLKCAGSAPCALEIGLCREEYSKNPNQEIAFILGDGNLKRFSIKHKNDSRQNRPQWRSSIQHGSSLVNDGKTPNRFRILVKDDRTDPVVCCRVYLGSTQPHDDGYVKVFERYVPRRNIPSPLIWLRVAGWQSGTIKLAEFEVAEYDGAVPVTSGAAMGTLPGSV